MEPFEFIWELDDQRIVSAIRQAEAKSSAELRVYVSDEPVDDPLVAARERFVRLGMHRTRDRNGVLIFVAPRSQNFAIVGDEAVHAKCGDAFWRDVAAAMRNLFATDHPTEAIVLGIARAGALLADQFPCRADDRNELPDAIARADDI